MCVQTIRCIQPGKGHFRRHAYTCMLSFIIEVGACACVIHVSVMNSNQEQKQPSIQNIRGTMPKISSHPQSDPENHGIFIRTQKYKQSNMHPCTQQAAAKHQIHQTRRRQTATLRAAVSHLKTKAQRRRHARGCCVDRVRWRRLLTFWMKLFRDKSAQASGFRKGRHPRRKTKSIKTSMGVALAANGATKCSLFYQFDDRAKEWREMQLGETRTQLIKCRSKMREALSQK
jgi:hypothetical protein